MAFGSGKELCSRQRECSKTTHFGRSHATYAPSQPQGPSLEMMRHLRATFQMRLQPEGFSLVIVGLSIVVVGELHQGALLVKRLLPCRRGSALARLTTKVIYFTHQSPAKLSA